MNKITFKQDDFLVIAKDIMIYHVMYVNNIAYKICDIEFYLYTDNHKDTHVPLDNNLLNSGVFCVIDGKLFYALGKPDNYLGVLIRAIKNKQTNEIIEGVAKIMLLAMNNMRLEKDSSFEKRIIRSGVRGVTGTGEFTNANYRYVTEWDKLKKRLFKYEETVSRTEDKECFVPPDNIGEDELEIMRKVWDIKQKFKNGEITDKNKEYFTRKLNEYQNTLKNCA